MDRLMIFETYRNHPWLYRIYKKLGVIELQMAHDFIKTNDHLGKGEFEFAINRMFLDNKTPTKNWKEILELLTCTNSAYKEAKK